MKPKLYSYFRSSCSYRVRIALYLKKIDFTYEAIHLLKNGGEQHQDSFQKISPLSQLPCLEHEGRALFQSLPIILYLEEKYPEPSLLPKTAFEKSQILSVCESINSSIQPLQNLSVLKFLEANWQGDKNKWVQHWVHQGFSSLETFLKTTAGDFCFGNQISCADIFLIPQIHSAKRFKVDMKKYPLLTKIEKQCLCLEAFQRASPENQPDSPPS